MRAFLYVLATSFLAATSVPAAEESIPLDKVPKPVLDAVKKRFPNAKMTEAAKEEADGKTEYEVSLTDGGTKYDIMLSPEGQITLIEKTIPSAALPKAVADAVASKYAGATIKLAEEMTVVKDGKEAIGYYEVLLATADKKTVEVEIAPDGTVKKTEEKKDGEEEKKEKK